MDDKTAQFFDVFVQFVRTGRAQRDDDLHDLINDSEMGVASLNQHVVEGQHSGENYGEESNFAERSNFKVVFL